MTVTMNGKSAAPLAPLALLASFALLASCKERQTQIRLKFPDTPDAGACGAQTNIKCANFIEFTAGTALVPGGFRSQCSPIDFPLTNLCDVAMLAEGQELFQLSPDTQLPISVEGKRVFPAISCNSGICPPKTIFAGETAEKMIPISSYEGQVLEIPIRLVEPCGPPEEFYFLPEGKTCAELCGGADDVVCDNVQGGCLCGGQPNQADVAARQAAAGADGGQGGIDGGQ
jgi:hypothetical protein